MLTAFGILLLLTLCGFIAYIGDLLGRRLGKKRLSVFGLRPKHTAILLTVVTGVLIAGVTFGAALVIVPGFREVVTRGERLVRENQYLEFQNSRARHTNDSLITKNRNLTADNGKLAQANTSLTRENGKLLQQRNELAQQKTALQADVTQLRTVNGELHANNTRLTQDNRSLDQQARGLRQTEATLTKRVGTLAKKADQYIKGAYIFRKGEQVEARVVLKDPPADDLREAINNLVYEGTQKARERVELKDVPKATSWVAPKDYPGDLPQTISGYRDWVVTQARKVHGKALLLRLVAAENCVREQPVPLRLEWTTNDLVFKGGSIITFRGVDGTLSEGAILGTLLDFLQSQVSSKAREASMLPWTGKDLGEVGMDTLLDLTRQIRSSNAAVVVMAKARQDTYRAGPLNVYLDLKSVSPVVEPR